MRAYTKICVIRSKQHGCTIRIGRFCVHARGLIAREVNPICPANAWRKFRWTSTASPIERLGKSSYNTLYLSRATS